jgi:hypothetical protein
MTVFCLPELDSGSQALHCQPQGDSVLSDLRNDGGEHLRNDGGCPMEIPYQVTYGMTEGSTYGMTVFCLPELDSGSQALHCQPHGDSVSRDLRNDGGEHLRNDGTSSS